MFKSLKSVITILSLFLIIVQCTSENKQVNEINKVLLVSFDGFRYDYLSKTNTPNFDKLIEEGVSSDGLIPIFPSKTFPNHYAIVTGLYPENNGFVSNNMYDPETGETFTMRDRSAVENPNWYGGEPIWNTAEKQGKKAGTMFWVGSEAPIQDMRPTHWLTYDESLPVFSRVDSVMNWFTAGNENEVDFATLYFSFVDTQGHRHGPDSPEVIQAIQQADSLIGYLTQQLQQNNLLESTNILIVSDHGMAEVSRDRIIVLDEFINPDNLDIIEHSPSLMANVAVGKLDEVYNSLKKNEEHFRVYKKEDIPDRFHLKNHPRVPELLILADMGYTINTRAYFDRNSNYPSGGTHGFDNQEKEMHGIFVAYGPDFKEGFRKESFENVHIYPLLAQLLHIQAAPNDGDFKMISDILK